MEEIEALINEGLDINQTNQLGFSLLMSGARDGDMGLVKLLVKNGAHINAKDKNHFTALYYSTSTNHLDIVKYLVEHGATIHDEIYMTALHKEFKEITNYYNSLNKSQQILSQK